MKKYISLFIFIILVAFVTPKVVASEGDNTVSTAVVQISSTTYLSWEEAIAAASDGDTLIALSDYSSPIIVDNSQNISIDFGKYTFNNQLKVEAMSSVKITGGKYGADFLIVLADNLTDSVLIQSGRFDNTADSTFLLYIESRHKAVSSSDNKYKYVIAENSSIKFLWDKTYESCSFVISELGIPDNDKKISCNVTSELIKAATNSTNGSKVITASYGYYYDSVTITIPSIKDVLLDETSIVYNGSEIKPAITVNDKNGDEISDSFYDVTYTNNINVGIATAIIKFKDDYSATIKKNFSITKATNKISVKQYNKTYSPDIQAFYVSANPKGGRPAYSSNNSQVTVDSATGLVTIAAGFIGQATITVTAESPNYKTASNKFKIVVTPQKPSIMSLKNNSGKKIKITFPLFDYISGYEIQFCTKTRFVANSHVYKIKNNYTSKKVISGLTKGTTYSFRIRTYTVVNGKKFYSPWSSVKKVKVKK